MISCEVLVEYHLCAAPKTFVTKSGFTLQNDTYQYVHLGGDTTER